MLDGILIYVSTPINAHGFPVHVRLLEELLNLDPKVLIHHCLLMYSLFIAGRLPEARAAIDAASPHCREAAKGILEHMRQGILRRLLELALEPARRHYRDLDYRRARKALEQIESE